MAFSTQRVTSDGTLVLLTISIEYFDRTEIAVLFDGIVDAYPWEWVGETDTKISFSPAVPNGVKVLLVRASDLSEVRHVLSEGAAFTDETMDENFKQILHIAQEARENASIADIFQVLNMHGYKITNVATGTNPLDAVNYAQFAAHDAQIIIYRDQAAASAVAAAASADDAADSAAAAAGVVAAHVAEADPHTQYLKESDVGTVAQQYDAATAKTNVAQTFSAVQKSTVTADNDLSINLAAVMDCTCTPTAGGALTFTNIAAGQKLEILFINNSNYAITKGANIKCASTLFSTISATGRYILAARCLDGTNVDLTVSGKLE